MTNANYAPWTEAEVQKVIALRKQGLTFYKIAKILGRNQYTVECKYYEYTQTKRVEKAWPPTTDPWPKAANFGAENFKIKSRNPIRVERSFVTVRSVSGSSLG